MPAAAITFFITLALLVAYVLYRMGEEKKGVTLWANARMSADASIAEAYRKAVMSNLPSNWRDAFLKFAHQVSHAVVILTVEGLRAVERPLLRLSHRMRRGGAPVGTGKEPSAFLKTITPDKKPDSGEEKPDSV